jgi:hypothetical protein
MADQNDDWKSATPPVGMQAGSNDGLRSNTGNGSTSSAAGSSGGMGADMTGGSGMSGKAFTADSVRESGARIASEARQYAGDMAIRAKEKGRSMFEQQKDSAAEQVSSVAHAFRSTADHLQGDGQAQVARYVGLVADQMESFGGRLREKDLDSLIHDAQNLARRSPGAVFAGTVVAGFLLARFLKSSSDRRSGSMGMPDTERYPASGMEADRFSAMPADRSAAGAAATTSTRSGNTGSSPANGAGAPAAGSTPGTVLGTTSVGTTPSSIGGSKSGGEFL